MQFKNINVTNIIIEDEFCAGFAVSQFFSHLVGSLKVFLEGSGVGWST